MRVMSEHKKRRRGIRGATDEGRREEMDRKKREGMMEEKEERSDEIEERKRDIKDSMVEKKRMLDGREKSTMERLKSET